MNAVFDLDHAVSSIAAFGMNGSRSDDNVRLTISEEHWPAVLFFLKFRRLTGLAVAAARAGALELSERELGELLDLQAEAMTQTLVLELRLLALADALEGKGISFVVLKGPALAHTVYPDPSWRPFADLDILVHAGDWRRSIETLADLGLHRDLPEPAAGFDERFGKAATHTYPDGYQVDLHRTLALGPFGLWVNPEELFERRKEFTLGGRTLARLGDTDLLVHACIHAILGWNPPLPLPLRDVAQVSAFGSVDWDAFAAITRRWKLSIVAERAIDCVRQELGVEPDGSANLALPPPKARERLALRAYTSAQRRSLAMSLASLLAVRGIGGKALYVRDLLLPDRAFLLARKGGTAPYLRRLGVAVRGMLPGVRLARVRASIGRFRPGRGRSQLMDVGERMEQSERRDLAAHGPTGRPRVLWLIKGLGAGGAERLLTVGAEGRDRESFEYETAYLLSWKDALVGELEAQQVPVYCLRSGRVFDLRWVGRLRALIRDRGYDIVHAQSPFVAGFARLVVRSLPSGSRPVMVSTDHLPWSGERRATQILDSLTFWMNDATVAVSPAVLASIPKRRRASVEVNNNGVPVAEVRERRRFREEERTALGVGPDEIVIATVAQITKQKDYPTLLKAARIAIDSGAPLRFVAMGIGPLEDEVRALHAELDLGDRFRFLGRVSDPPRVLSACDMFTLASRYEGLSLALVEAMSLGLPIVATSVRGTSYVLADGEYGVMVPAGRAELLAQAILDLTADPLERARLGEAASIRAWDFDSAAMISRNEDLYRRLLAASNRSRKHPMART